MKRIGEKDQDFICSITAPCFQLLSLEETVQIQETKTQIYYRKGENLTKQGTYASYILFILKGVVKEYIEEKDKNLTLQLLTPGDFVGLNTLFTDEAYNYSAGALTDVQVLLIDRDTLKDIIGQNANFAFDIVQNNSGNHQVLYRVIRNLMYKQTNGRVASTLLYLAEDKFAPFELYQHMTRKDIAEFAGISTESTVKIIKNFERDGIVELKDKEIHILQKEQLEEIAEKG